MGAHFSKLPTRHQSVDLPHPCSPTISKLPTRHQSLNVLFIMRWKVSKLPTRHQSRTRHTINLVYKKAKSNLGYKNPFFK